jgi:hypothetical protein
MKLVQLIAAKWYVGSTVRINTSVKKRTVYNK